MKEGRLKWLAAGVLIWGGFIFYNLISLQVFHHEEYLIKARGRQERLVEVPASRGAILDRSGRPLALSMRTDSVIVDPIKLPDLEVATVILSRVLNTDRGELYNRLKAARDSGRGYLRVKRGLTVQEADNIRSLNLDWVTLKSETQRHYPKATLAAHVLGGVDFEETGNAGIEQALDDELHAEPGEARLLTDVHRRGIDQHLANEAHSGAELTLTIDERLQFVAETEIAKAVIAHGAISGSVVVMNPYDGQILALASYPTYDPNEPPADPKDPARENHATTVPFEPGSVFKVITLSAALETTKLTPESMINCHGGVLTLFGRTIHDSHVGINWVIPMAQVLARSSNIGAIEVGLQVGRDNMYDYVRRFGFGQQTGIPLAGETRGHLTPLKKWQATSLASVAFGQEISVTTLQLAQAASVIANGGLLVRPRLVLKKNGELQQGPEPVRVLKPDTAITMRQMMEGVVLFGTGTAAKIPGYTVGGKTGSAQIYDYAKKVFTHTYNGSFMGFAPVTNPAVVVVVTLNGTHGESGFGGASAAPVFKIVTAEALRIFDIPKDLPEAGTETRVLTAAAAPKPSMDDSAVVDFGPTTPNPLDDKDDDEAAAPNAAASDAKTAKPSTPTVPNFRGMTLRDVLVAAAAKGLNVQPDGSGVARVQYPPPGAELHQGERIRVQFAR